MASRGDGATSYGREGASVSAPACNQVWWLPEVSSELSTPENIIKYLMLLHSCQRAGADEGCFLRIAGSAAADMPRHEKTKT